MAQQEEEQKEGAPAWMVSFGDMMTLILTFFILMVSMSRTQQEGLVAKGVGSFLVAVRSFGLPGILDNSEKATVFENVRRKFNLPPEADPSRREDHVDASQLELIRSKAAKALQPHDELNQPAIATFATDSSELDAAARSYIDMLAPTIRPGPGQALLLEGHARDAGPNHAHQDRWLAHKRASAVKQYLVEEHEYPESRVEVRAWMSEIEVSGAGVRSVDARLVIPAEGQQ